MIDYKKYIKIRDDNHDKEKTCEHYKYCNKNKIPYIIVKETGEYATIKVDSITIPQEINKHKDIVEEKFGQWIDDAIRNDLIKKGEFNSWGVYSEMTVKKQCAEYYAEAAFNIYVDVLGS